jgi:hypothetical protein
MTQLMQWLLRDDTIRLPRERATHSYVIGQPGTGKSRALESWIMQDIAAGHGVGVIDPHGDLFRNLLVRLSFKPEVWERIVIIDPCSKHWVTTFNPLDALPGYSTQRLALFLSDIIGKIWKLDLASAPRTTWLLSNTFLALAELDLTLLHLPRFLLDRGYREGLLPGLTNPSALTFFEYEYPKSAAAVHQWTSPVLNKIGNLIFDPDMSLLLAGRPRIRFRQIMDQQLILLVNLPKGTIGEGVSALMGAFIVAHIQKSALARENSHQRPPFYLYLDEFQNYTTDNIRDILSESRKYCLSLILVNQYLEQLTPEIRSALLNTAGSIACFRTGYQDAYELAKEIFPSQHSAESENRLDSPLFSARWPHGFGSQRQPAEWDQLAGSLSGLRFREFWHKERGAYRPTKQRTYDMPLPQITEDVMRNVWSLVAGSGKLYSRSKEAVQKEVAAYHEGPEGAGAGFHEARRRNKDEEIPFWGV